MHNREKYAFRCRFSNTGTFCKMLLLLKGFRGKQIHSNLKNALIFREKNQYANPFCNLWNLSIINLWPQGYNDLKYRFFFF